MNMNLTVNAGNGNHPWTRSRSSPSMSRCWGDGGLPGVRPPQPWLAEGRTAPDEAGV